MLDPTLLNTLLIFVPVMVQDIGRVAPCRRSLSHERRRERNGNAESRHRRFLVLRRRRDDDTRRLYVPPHLVGG